MSEARSHSICVRGYDQDTDGRGIVHHATCQRWMERAPERTRSDWLRGLGERHDVMAAPSRQSVVSEVDLRFRRPARLDHLLDTLGAS
jgi:YbgC/YbaW family acyl-CoA thioester hydrolase